MSTFPINNSIVESPQMGVATIDQLPRELHRMIFSYLDGDDLKNVRQVCSSFRDSVNDLTYSSFCRQSNRVLAELQPYFSEDEKEYLNELIRQFRPQVRVVAGLPLVFDTKNARAVFRHELIKLLSKSSILLDLKWEPLFQESFSQVLPKESQHLPVLTTFMQQIEEIQNNPNLTNDEKLSWYSKVIKQRFDRGLASAIMMRDAIKLVDLEVLKLFIDVLLRQNYSVALEAIGCFPLSQRDQISYKTIKTLIAHGAFDKVEPVLQLLSNLDQQNDAFCLFIDGLIANRRSEEARTLVLAWKDHSIRDRYSTLTETAAIRFLKKFIRF